jgi:hypothetical protein
MADSILHCWRYSTRDMSLLFGAGFNSTKNMERGSKTTEHIEDAVKLFNDTIQ